MPRKWFILTRLISIAALATPMIGCQSNNKGDRPPLTAPEATVELHHYAGSALSGPQARTIDDKQLDQIWSLNARALAVEKLPADGFERIARNARLIIASRGGTPVTPSARLTPGLLGRSVPVDFEIDSVLGDPDRRAELIDATGGVAVGSTAELVIDVPRPSEPILAPTRSGLTIRISRLNDGKSYQLSVVSEDLIPIPVSMANPPTSAEDNYGNPILQQTRIETETEMLVLDRTFESDSDRYLLAIPIAFNNSDAKGVVIDLAIQTQLSADAKTETIATVKTGALESADAVRAKLAITTDSAEELAMSTALSALAQTGDEPRGAMAYLAGQSGATLTESVVLVADNPLVQRLAKSVVESSPGLQKFDHANVAWLLERMTIAALGAAENDVANPLSAGVYAAMSSYAGEVGRQIDSLKSLIGQSNGTTDLNNRLIVENRLFLEDSSPASRVRAFDWLHARGLAPAGYDPLATARQRRAALETANAPAPVVLPAPMQTTQPSNKP